MARIPSTASLQRRLNDLKARETKLKARQAANTGQNIGKGQARPTIAVKYKSIFTDQDFIINASKKGIEFFGKTELGLADPDASPRLPHGFHPARIKALKGRSAGSVETAELSGRKYMQYSIEATADTQASFTAPISADTVTALKTKVQTIMKDKRDDVGEYGRIWFEPERPLFSESGSTGAIAP